jgi:hypothetical protein
VGLPCDIFFNLPFNSIYPFDQIVGEYLKVYKCGQNP